MPFIGNIYDKLRRHPKRVVFPEGNDPRVLQAAYQLFNLQLGIPLLLGERTNIRKLAEEFSINLQGIRIIDPATNDNLESFARRYCLMRQHERIAVEDARSIVAEPNFFATMMTAMHQADVMVAGVRDKDGALLRPVMQILCPPNSTPTIVGCQVLELVDNRQIGTDGILFLADCDIHQNPTVEELADIALSAARFACLMTSTPHRVAILSNTTRPADPTKANSKEYAAALLAQERAEKENIQATFDGELQADTAIVPEIAVRKLGADRLGSVAGRATCLIFPTLESAGITTRLIKHLTHANTFGDIYLGIERPVAELSRGSTAHDILGVTAILGEQCNRQRQKHPDLSLRIPGE